MIYGKGFCLAPNILLCPLVLLIIHVDSVQRANKEPFNLIHIASHFCKIGADTFVNDQVSHIVQRCLVPIDDNKFCTVVFRLSGEVVSGRDH